jgi:hypothetical protein
MVVQLSAVLLDSMDLDIQLNTGIMDIIIHLYKPTDI